MILDLPDEMIYTIASHLPPRDVLNLRSTCKRTSILLARERSVIILDKCIKQNFHDTIDDMPVVLHNFAENLKECLNFLQKIFEIFNDGQRSHPLYPEPVRYIKHDVKLRSVSRRSRTVDALVPMMW